MTSTRKRWAVILLLVGAGVTTAAEQPQQTSESATAQSDADALLESLPSWLRTLKISGDFRYRHERADNDATDTARDRDRIRARLIVSSEVNEEVDVTIGLASGTNNSATNTNQDLGDAFSSKDIWLDLAFMNYHPASIEGFNLAAGKIKNLYYHPGNSDLLFDTDVRPEGIAATYKKALNEDVSFFGTFGGYWVEERSSSLDTALWGLQGGLTGKIPGTDGVTLTAGAGYYDYTNLQGQIALGSSATNFRGNRSVGTGYESDFEIVQGFGQAAFKIAGHPCAVFGDYIVNQAAESDEDTGYLVGASLGKCKKPGSWAFAYNYRDLEADCELGALSDSTFAGGGTNVRGHKLSVGYQLAKNCKVGLNYMIGERTRTVTADYDVLQFEFNFKF